MATAATRVRPGNLTASLVAFAALELFFNRLATRLFLPQLPQAPLGEGTGSTASRLLAASGPLLFHLTGVLALVVLLGATTGLLWRGELFPRPMRLVVAIMGLPFWLLSAYGVVFDIVPARFFPHLEATFGLLSVLVAASALGVATRGRIKLGVALCALPGILEAGAIFGDRMGMLPTATSAFVSRAGELALLAACVAAPFLLPPRPARERPWRRPLAAAVVLTLALVVAMATRFDLLQAALLYGLRLELPRPSTLLGVAYVAAAFGWCYATVQLLVDKGGMRLAGYGLLLLAIAGYQVTSPVELALALLGLLALSVGELRAASYGDPARPRIGAGEWRAYVGRLATAAGDGTSPDDSRSEAVVVEEGELEVSRIRAYRRGWPVTMRLVRRRGALVELEMTIGAVAHAGPDARMERPRSWLARGGASRLPRVRTGDATFDQKLSVHGHAPLADADLRRRLVLHAGDGAVSLWRGAAARYHVAGGSQAERPAPPFSGALDEEASVANVVAALDTLADLIDASAA